MIRLTRRSVLGTLAAGLALPVPGLLRAAAPMLRVGAILPLGGSGLPEAGVNNAVPAAAARMGLVHAFDDLIRAAPVDQPPLALLLANAPEASSARRAAERLVQRDGATVLIGGFSTAEALAIAEVADRAGAMFINIAAPADSLRHDLCGSSVLHVEARASSYLAALTARHIAEGRNRWHLIVEEGADSEALLPLAEAQLGDRITGSTRISPDPSSFAPAFEALKSGRVDVALLLADWLGQLDVMSRAEPLGLPVPITGFPFAATQTRTFYNRTRQTAPGVGATTRVALWDGAVTTPEAKALNADFLARWRQPMDGSAWAAGAALRLAAQGALGAGSPEGRQIAAWLAGQRALDMAKDETLPVDHTQLRQPLFALRPDPGASHSTAPEAMVAWAEYLGRIEDPAIPVAAASGPATDPAPVCGAGRYMEG